LRLVYRLWKLTTSAFIVFDWLKRIEPISITLYDPRIRSKPVHPWASAELFPKGVEILLILFRLLTMQCIVVHKTLHPFYPISLCWLDLNSQSFVWNAFYTSAIRMLFLFYKLPDIHFSEHYLQISHNLKTISTARTTWRQSSTIPRVRNCGVIKLFVTGFFEKAHIGRVTETRVTSISSLLRILRNLTPLELPYNALT